MSKVTIKELTDFFEATFPERVDEMPRYDVVEKDYVEMTQIAQKNHLRPGGYISGPTQMALADHIAYIAVFTRTGLIPMAVTSNLNIDFLRPCIGSSVTAKARLLKLGRTLAVVSVEMYSDTSEKISSRASVTYSIPQ